MRILHVISSLDCTGTARQLVGLTAGLARTDVQTKICVLRAGGALQSELATTGAELSSSRRTRVADLFAWRQLRNQIAKWQPDLVHTWDEPAYTFGGMAALAAGVPAIISQVTPDRKGGLVDTLLRARLASRTVKYVVPNLAARQKLMDHGTSASQVITIPLGISPHGPPPTSREEFLREFGIAEDAHCVAIVGRFLLRKRIKDLIWATDMLKFYGVKIQVLLFGSGPQAWRLNRYRQQCQVERHVHFVGERPDVARWLPHCEVLWQADDPPGTGCAILEAQAAGVPVVASNIPAHRELIVPEQTGILVRSGARSEFANAANRLFVNRDLARRFGQAGQERIKRDFSLAVMSERFIQLYREVLVT